MGKSIRNIIRAGRLPGGRRPDNADKRLEGEFMKYFLIFGGIAALIAVIIVAVRYYERKRREALEKLARLLDYSFSAKGSDSLLASVNQFHLFTQGHRRRITNVLTGRSDDTLVTIMDYRYTTGGGKNSHTWVQTVILYQCSRLHLPVFTLRPENLFHKIGNAFGYQDIDFDSNPTFSRQYLLRGTEEQAIRNLFSDACLLYYEQHKGLCTEGTGDKLAFYRSSKRVPPPKLRSFIEEGSAVFRLFTTA